MNITESERAKYNKVWNDKAYSVVSPAMRHLDYALEWMKPEPGASISDWGSGSGKASDKLDELGFKVRMVDIASNAYKGKLEVIEACLWELPDSLDATDYGICCDVMEHIPPEHVYEVLKAIAKRTKTACYFQIALFHDSTFTHAGPLHLSVFQHDIWRKKILDVFSTAEFAMIKNKHLLALAKP
jgi:2-polyprenyl-3-methyl-5-hydroxy-6-metoxy-1,4-benzoquinol methylase